MRPISVRIEFIIFVIAGALLLLWLLWFLFGPEKETITRIQIDPTEGVGGEIEHCGEFGFGEPNIVDTYSRNGIDVELDFEFNPTTEDCFSECDSIGFVQIVRTVSLRDTSQFYYPSTQKKQRATNRGWYVDRGEGYKWLYYGMKNDTTFQPYVRPGSRLERAIMRDRPYRPDNYPYLGIRWQAVTVPVCLNGAGGCDDRYGYYAWSWRVTTEGEVEAIEDTVAMVSLKHDVYQALSKWNEQANNWDAEECFLSPQN